MTARGWRTWRPALRAARRDARRNVGRSLLTVALVALPALGVTGAAGLVHSAHLEPDEQAAYAMGAADARLEPQPDRAPVVQPYDRATSYDAPARSGDDAASVPERWSRAEVASLLPDDARLRAYVEGSTVVGTTDGYRRAGVHGVDLTVDGADGMAEVVEGRVPAAPDEVAVTPGLVETAPFRDPAPLAGEGVAVGDTLRLGQEGRTHTVVGVVRPRADPGVAAVVTTPAAAQAVRDRGEGPHAARAAATSWLVDVPGSVTWADVRKLNASGVAVLSRAVLADPPPSSEVPAEARGDRGIGADEAVIVALVAVCGVLEVVLLAGAAFAVGTRAQQRTLALVAAVGGDRRDVRRVVLAQGLVLGALGSAVGAALGGAVAVAGRGALSSLAGAPVGRVDVGLPELASVLALGTVTGLLAALVPAVTASRLDVVAALRGHGGVTSRRSGAATTRQGWAVLGGVALAGGLLLVVSGTAAVGMVRIAVGTLLSQLGLVLLTPALVAGAAAAARWLPLAPRLALRDAGRHQGRTSPAVAAVAVAVAGVVALATGGASDQAERVAEHAPVAPEGTAVVNVGSSGDGEAVRQAVAETLPEAEVTALRDVSLSACAGSAPCAHVATVRPPGCPAVEPAEGCPRTRGRSVEVGGPAGLRALTGRNHPEAAATLARGGVVVFDDRHLREGRASLTVRTSGPDGPRSARDGALAPREEAGPGQERDDAEPARATTGPARTFDATYVPGPAGRRHLALVSPGAADALGLAGPATRFLATTPGGVDEAQERALRDALLAGDPSGQSGLYVERGPERPMDLAYVALAAAATVVMLAGSAVATGLAVADGRRDQATLAAVGASPSLRRKVAAAQAGTIALLGAGLGVLTGLVPGVASAWPLTGSGYTPPGAPTDQVYVALPWPVLGAVLVVVPLVAVAGAALVTGTRRPGAPRGAA